MASKEKIEELQIKVNGLLVEECHLRAKQKSLKEKRKKIEKEIFENKLVLSGKLVKETNQLNITDSITESEKHKK